MKLKKEGNIYALLKGNYLEPAPAIVTCVTRSCSLVSAVISHAGKHELFEIKLAV